jgi:predicted nucleotidyltransferase
MNSSSSNNGVPEKVRKKVSEVDAAARVILFGSRAREDNKADSDWDFLIITQQTASGALQDEIRTLLYDIELEIKQVISSIIEDEDTWRKYKHSELYHFVENEGVEVLPSKAA